LNFSTDFGKKKNLSSGSRVVPYGQTDGQTNRGDEANCRFSQFFQIILCHSAQVASWNILTCLVNKPRGRHRTERGSTPIKGKEYSYFSLPTLTARLWAHPASYLTGPTSLGQRKQSVKLTDYPHPDHRLKTSGALPPHLSTWYIISTDTNLRLSLICIFKSSYKTTLVHNRNTARTYNGSEGKTPLILDHDIKLKWH